MKITSALSSIALVVALTFSGSVLAQSKIGDVTIPDENLASFQEKCAAINSASTESLAEKADAGNDQTNDATATGSTAAANASASDDGDLASEDNLDELLASLTPEQCKEAGLIK
jgi:hypothetical protein